MGTVDDIMARCPLKQEVRATLWEPFLRAVAGGRPLNSYLTLYSPPMMDIKHLYRRSLLEFDGESFPGVIAVTYNRSHYAAALEQSSGRPQLLLYGDINELITSENSENAKRLRQRFPLQAINLDYTNSLFGRANKQPISRHLAAVDELIRLQHQHKAHQFALLLTTRAERSEQPEHDQLTDDFLKDLAHRVDENITHHAVFRSSFTKKLSQNGLMR